MPRKHRKARARRVPGVMNGLEQWYADTILQPRLLSGDITRYDYEKWTFKLAERTTYTPDFVVYRKDGEIEVHETKGTFFYDDARAKWKIAAGMWEMFHWVWIVIEGGKNNKRVKKEERL